VPEGEDPEEFMGKVKVEKYVPIEGGEWGQTDAVGTVIDFGRVNIREDDIESGTQMYVFDKPDMMPPEFAASITTTPFFANQSYGNTGKDRFNDFWVKSIDEELWVNATWGNRPNVGYDNAGENVGDFTSVENKNRTIDSTQFPAEYESDCWFGAQAFNRLNVSDKSVFTTYTFVNGGSLQGIIPNLNDPLVRKSLMHYSDTLNLKIN
jgi:hypothetical protein